MLKLAKCAHAVLTGVAFALLTACASLPTDVTDIVVGKDFVKVLGTTVQTPDELVKLLNAKSIRKVKLRVDPEVGYERIGKVIYTVSRAGVEIELVNASASQPPSPVVFIQYTVSEKDPEQLETIVSLPLEQVFKKLDRVVQINTSISHGTVEVEIHFKGKATKQDLGNVIGQIEMLNFGNKVNIISRTIDLRPPRFSYDAVQENP